jgi:hypothetical protein
MTSMSLQFCNLLSGRRQWEKIFAGDLATCGRVTLEEWRGRGVMTKLREMIASLLRDQV